LVSIDGELCILALPYSNTTFRATSVKPYLTPTTKIEDIQVEFTSEKHAIDEVAGEELATLPVKRGRGRPRKNPNITIFL
jgi:hypothetical protein